MATMSVPAVDLAAQWAEIREEAEPLVIKRLASGDYLGADVVSAFESEFAAYVGGGVHAVACSSGTDAVELMVRATTPEGATVGVPLSTFVATLAAVERSGRTPVMTLPPAKTANMGENFTDAPAAIAVWLYGSTAEADDYVRECGRDGVMLLEDCSQAHGNRRAGTIGVAAAWSLYPSKTLGGIGQGGIVTFRDSLAAAKARRIREHGYDKATDRHWGRGFNMRMDGINAEVLRVKLRHLDKWTARRREIAKAYHNGLCDLDPALNSYHRVAEATRAIRESMPHLRLPEIDEHHALHQYVVTINDGRRDRILAYLRAQGIGAMVHYRTTADGRENEWTRSCLSLPIWPTLTDEQIAYVIEHVKRAVRKEAA